LKQLANFIKEQRLNLIILIVAMVIALTVQPQNGTNILIERMSIIIGFFVITKATLKLEEIVKKM
jgi:hypothetical protein